jgi:hypothetical protein
MSMMREGGENTHQSGQFIPSTDPRTRYSLQRIEELSQNDDLYIYDYTSFTSRLVDNREFIDRLAMYCMDTSVYIFDTHEGPIVANLGQLINSYNQEVNFECPFDVTRILGLPEPLILHMATSGPLGVPGNIVTSTTTHGIIQAEITGSVNRGNSLGDDGVAVRDASGPISREEVMELHQSIGAIEESKACWWMRNSQGEGKGWHYVKRPIDRVDDMIHSGWMPDFPNYPVLLGVEDGVHTVPPARFEDRRIMCAKQVGRYFDRVLRSGHRTSEFESSFVLTVFRYLYGSLRLDKHGSWPNASKSSKASHTAKLKHHFVPPLSAECFERSWIEILLERRGSDSVILIPKEYSGEMDVPEDPLPGDSFEFRGDRILGTMEMLGMMEKRKIYEEVLVLESEMPRILRLVNGELRSMYTYTFLDVPSYWSILHGFCISQAALSIAEDMTDDYMDEL